MPPTKNEQFDALSDFLASRRKAILLAWRQAAAADPEQTTGRSLNRGQFNDHIPEVLDSFERKLRARRGGAAAHAHAHAADVETKKEEVKHGLHRWQQGYRLQELMREWGHLQLCLFEELDAFAAAHPEVERATMVEANRQMITLVNEAIGESTGQYERMQQAEAAGRMNDLEGALANINEIERRRAALIREAVHDLSGNVFGVTVAAKLLGGPDIAAADRAECAQLLQQGVQSVTAMLGDLTELARLEAGKEKREISRFDAAALVTELGNANRPIADGRGLYLEVTGSRALSVDGDPAKVRRLLQNLLLNGLKYTERGGVTLSLGVEGEKWWLMIKDTGPGLLAGPDAPMIVGLKEATASARESDEKAAAIDGETSQVLVPPRGGRAAMRPSPQQPGEGIGLSIVKRLCELLDASLEMASSAETGTTFRIVFPRHYQVSRASNELNRP
ncbi:MAG: HAMP domain-containing sensor histidine kinase [Opitutaceae bacterium]|nr:HAMP domain-containing sensor histidine kinase [Opitutaceae bacterium]